MYNIDDVDLRRIDLNLLVALEALLLEGGVSRAAIRMGVGQPAMSHSLMRLRHLLGDEILTRVPGGMRPTPRALVMANELQATLAQVRSFLAPDAPFDPLSAETVFRVGIIDTAEALLVPRVLASILELAPRVRLELRSLDGIDVLAELDSGRLDLAVGTFANGSVHHKRRLLFTDGYLSLYNPTLIDLPDRLTLGHYTSLPLVVVSASEPDAAVAALRRLGVQPRIALSTPHLAALPSIVRSVPALATVHAQLAHHFASMMGLMSMPVPVEMTMPDVRLSVLWHASNDRSPAHVWFRELIAATVRKLKR